MESQTFAKAQKTGVADLPWRTDAATAARYWSVALAKAQLTYFEVPAGARFERHGHPSEQITLVLEGSLVFELDEARHILGPGEVIAVPGDVPHAVVAGPEGARAVDAWSPPQEQYGSRLAGQAARGQ